MYEKPVAVAGYLTPDELSRRFRNRVSVRTLANWRCLGIGPRYRKIGGRILYPVDEVEAWEEKRTASCTSGYGPAALSALFLNQGLITILTALA